MNFKIPTSEKLKSLEKHLADKKALAVLAKTELLRLTYLTRNDSYDTTVINRTRPITKATIDVWDEPTANLSTGIRESEEVSLREDDRNRILRGEQLAEKPDITAQINDQHRLCRAINDAIESIVRDINREKAVLAQKYCEELKPSHDEDMQILCKGLVDSHTVLLRLNKLRQHLIDSDLGYRGICLNMPDSFLGHPLNRHSDFAEFLNAAKRAGYINKVPAEYAS